MYYTKWYDQEMNGESAKVKVLGIVPKTNFGRTI